MSHTQPLRHGLRNGTGVRGWPISYSPAQWQNAVCTSRLCKAGTKQGDSSIEWKGGKWIQSICQMITARTCLLERTSPCFQEPLCLKSVLSVPETDLYWALNLSYWSWKPFFKLYLCGKSSCVQTLHAGPGAVFVRTKQQVGCSTLKAHEWPNGPVLHSAGKDPSAPAWMAVESIGKCTG